ncbi:hypothetical protein NCCP2495_29460 [Dietzia sp. NCCP-2495]|nr:hypothetical protein NCCP2495_29460 [Dietzia sp. NCCP-2495]
MPEEFPNFPHHTQIKQYLDSYADAFDLLRSIEFETRVVHAQRLPDGGWELTTERTGAAAEAADGESSEASPDGAGRETRQFDLLVVGNGHHWDPRWWRSAGRRGRGRRWTGRSRRSERDATGAGGKAGQHDVGGGDGEVRTAELADAERVDTHLVGEHALLHEVTQDLRLVDGAAGAVDGDVAEGVEAKGHVVRWGG